MKIIFSVEDRPRLLAPASVLASTASIAYIAAAQDMALAQALQLALISGHGQVMAFLAGSRG